MTFTSKIWPWTKIRRYLWGVNNFCVKQEMTKIWLRVHVYTKVTKTLTFHKWPFADWLKAMPRHVAMYSKSVKHYPDLIYKLWCAYAIWFWNRRNAKTHPWVIDSQLFKGPRSNLLVKRTGVSHGHCFDHVCTVTLTMEIIWRWPLAQGHAISLVNGCEGFKHHPDPIQQ